MAEPWRKNAAGVKSGADMYRNINGVRWEWLSAGNIDQLRAAGIRCRRSRGEIFVHPEDENLAWDITYNAGPKSTDADGEGKSAQE
ncbi:MAG: hypothetical protein DI537_10580 [Stutzerimonas stutzeri]|nr:MAG: hypothetical protein DI537_10580 [Stutzerimonas stutzeri]